MLILSCAHRQPCLILADHKVQLPSKIAKLSEIQLTLGISDFFAKQQGINIMMLAQDIMAGLSLGTSYTAVRAPFLGELERKIHKMSDLTNFQKKRESTTQEKLDDSRTGLLYREESFDLHGLLFMPFSTVASAGVSKLPALLTGRNKERLCTDLHSRSCCSSLGQDRSNGSAFPSLNQWNKWVKQELGKINTWI